MQADIAAKTHCRQHRRFGKNFGIRAYANFEVLRPSTAGLQHLFNFFRLLRAWLDTGQVLPQNLVEFGSQRLRTAGVPTGLLFNHPLQQTRHKGHAGGLDSLQIARRQQPWQAGIAAGFFSVIQHSIERCDHGQAARRQRRAQQISRVRQVQQSTAGERQGGDVVQAIRRHKGHNRPQVGYPDPCDQQRARMVARQAISDQAGHRGGGI